MFLTAHGPLLFDKLSQVEFVILEEQDVWHHREDCQEDAHAGQDGAPRARREAEAALSYQNHPLGSLSIDVNLLISTDVILLLCMLAYLVSNKGEDGKRRP